MADLVHGLFATPAGIQSIRHVNYKRIRLSDVPIGVNHSRWNSDKDRIFLTHGNDFIVLRFALAVLPEVKLIRAIKENKPIGLIGVLVGAALDAGLCTTEVTH